MRVITLFILLGTVLLCYAFEGNNVRSHVRHERPTNHWAVEVAPGKNPDDLAAEHGMVNLGPVGSLKGIYLFQDQNIQQKKRVNVVNEEDEDNDDDEDLPSLHESPHVKWAENQVARKRFLRSLPTDPLFPNQWHLKNPAGVDINIERVWDNGITGAGVNIAMVDDGLQSTHPDIAPNYLEAGSFDFNENDPFPIPHSGDDHGTSAGGVAAAKNNNGVCGSGAAPDAKLSGIRLIADFTTDTQEALGLSFRSDLNHIYSNSWGPNDDGRRLERPGRLTTKAMEDSVTNGRGGKGVIYVWAGGNGRSAGDNCNYDGYANSRFTLTIGATDHQGKQAYYSENCAALFASAPSSGSGKSITTTDLLGSAGTAVTDCTSTFGGTSAAAPLVAGIVALILQANPNLGWRDVQQIFVNTSRMTDSTDSDWVVNGGGYHHNHKYGFGLVDSYAAVQMAREHTNLPAWKVSSSAVSSVGKPVTPFAPISDVIQINDILTVESVEITVTVQHPSRGHLHVTLISPSGTASVLQEVHNDYTANIDGWNYTTVRSWGENSVGAWTLKIEDKVSGSGGTFTSWQLHVYGH